MLCNVSYLWDQPIRLVRPWRALITHLAVNAAKSICYGLVCRHGNGVFLEIGVSKQINKATVITSNRMLQHNADIVSTSCRGLASQGVMLFMHKTCLGRPSPT